MVLETLISTLIVDKTKQRYALQNITFFEDNERHNTFGVKILYE